VTGGRFTPYNLVRHTFVSDRSETPASVDQLVLSKGGDISTMAGLDVVRIPEPDAAMAAAGALLTVLMVVRLRRRGSCQARGVRS